MLRPNAADRRASCSVAEGQQRHSFCLVLPARVLTSSFNRHPMRGGTRITRCAAMHIGNVSGRVVRKLSVAGVAVAALVAAPAMAGDLPINAPPYAPPYAPLYRAPPIIALNWTGCYLGGHIGGSFVDKKFGGPFVDNAVPSTFGAPTSFAISDPSADLNSTGLLGGGQVGCNFQFAANWVIGFEADASGANQQGGGDSRLITEGAVLNGTLPGITTVVSSNGTASSRTDFIATATGRLGYTFGRLGQGMVYAKGGAAWAHDKYQFNGQVLTSACGVVAIDPFPPQCVLGNSFVTPFNFGASETRVGWTVGAVSSGQYGRIGRSNLNMITWIS